MIELSMVSEMGPVLFRVDLVPMRRSSVLSLLSLRKFCNNHVFIVEMQVSMLLMGGVTVEVQVEFADDVTKGQ